MRAILYVTAVVVLVAGLFLEDRRPNTATASLAGASDPINVSAVSAAIDVKSLPRLDIADEVYH